MKAVIKLLIILVLSIMMFSSGNNIIAQDKIKSVKIGKQVWMTENLNVDRFQNGDLIPEAKTNEEWIIAGDEKKPAWCYFKNSSENGEKFGKLYNWYAVNDKRRLAPNGWHLPTKKEFQRLIATVNKNSNILKSLGQGKGNGVGTNTSGFSALLSGDRYLDGYFYDLEYVSYFWTSTEAEVTHAFNLYLDFDNSVIYFGHYNKVYGFSVRCIKD